jgi:NADPH-dependent 2,4-dienoyl-CoA reductase/sulfur reductase-like enzyme
VLVDMYRSSLQDRSGITSSVRPASVVRNVRAYGVLMGQRVVVIGGDAGGMTAISQIRKRRPDAEVVALEKGSWTSYSACGIPFVVGGSVEGGIERLIARSPAEHRANGIDLRMHHEATAIDLDRRSVSVRDLDAGRDYELGFDDLHIGTGGLPIRPQLPGIDLPFIHGVQTLDDAARLIEFADRLGCGNVVVVGGGYIGLEMAEAFLQRGCTSTIVDRAPHPLGLLDPDMGALVTAALARHGVDVRSSTAVLGFEPGAVLTDAGAIPADLVVLGLGVAPNSDIAGDAGLELGVGRAIRVDDRQETSASGVWAAGDCCESTHLVSGEKVHIALGTYANRQARVAGINIGGGDARSPRVLGTAVTKLCETEIGMTGLNTASATAAGFDVVSPVIESSTKAGYYPGASPIRLKFVIDRPSRRLLGAQIVGGEDAAKRIDTCATAITASMTIDQILDLDLAYAPPFSPVWDPVAVAARESLKAI